MPILFHRCRLFFALAGLVLAGVTEVSANRLPTWTDWDDIRDHPYAFWQDAITGDFRLPDIFGNSYGLSDFRRTAITTSPSISLRKYQHGGLTGAPGETVSVDLRNFAMSGHSTFTLQGTATTSFILNITGQFSLSGYSRIILAGGVQWDHVFFNVPGAGSVVSLKGSANFWGTLNALQRTVSMRGHATVWGRVFANQIILRGGARIVPPPPISP